MGCWCRKDLLFVGKPVTNILSTLESSEITVGKSLFSYLLLLNLSSLSPGARSSESSIFGNGMGNTEKEGKNISKILSCQILFKILFLKISEACTVLLIALQDMRGIIGMWVREHLEVDFNLFYNSRYCVSLLQFSHLYHAGNNIYLNIIIRWNNVNLSSASTMTNIPNHCHTKLLASKNNIN